MARFPWMNQLDIGMDENGMPTQPVTSIVRPSEPIDDGQIAARTQQMIDNYLMELSNPEAQADAAPQQQSLWQPPQQQDQQIPQQGQQQVGPEAMPPPMLPPMPVQQQPAIQMPMSQNIYRRSQPPVDNEMPAMTMPPSVSNTQIADVQPSAAPQIWQPPTGLPPATPEQSAPSFQTMPVSNDAVTSGPIPQQGGNFLQDAAYSAFGNAYTPWKRNETGQWNPDRGAGIGDRLGTLIGSLARASAGLRFNPSGGGSFGYDPYAGSYLTRQRNEHLMNTGRMNDQYDPAMQAIMGQATGARELARRQAAGYPTPLTPEQSRQFDLDTRRMTYEQDRSLNPNDKKYWTPEQHLDWLRKVSEVENEGRRNDPYAAVKTGFGILKNYRDDPTVENYYIAANAVGPKADGTLYTKEELNKVLDGIFGDTPGPGLTGMQSEDYPEAAEALNFSMGITPVNTAATSEAQKTLNFTNQFKDQPISPIVLDKIYRQAENEIAPTSWYHPQRTEEEIKALEKYNESVDRKVPVWQYRPGLRLYNDPYYREGFNRMMGRETNVMPGI